jgi:hypothetical protein
VDVPANNAGLPTTPAPASSHVTGRIGQVNDRRP